MTINIWQGSHVRLRALEPEDWETFHAWDEDSQVARDCYWIPFPKSREAAKKWATEVSLAEPKGDVFRWVIENLEGEMVGTINTHTCDRRNGTFEYGIAIARKHWRKGYAAEAIRLVLRYYFRELGYQKVMVHIYDFNEASIRLHEKLGFQREGRLRRMGYTQGKYHDDIVLGLTVEEFKEDQDL
jgi:RimJ/RimL family protein N-acetyltransferase